MLRTLRHHVFDIIADISKTFKEYKHPFLHLGWVVPVRSAVTIVVQGVILVLFGRRGTEYLSSYCTFLVVSSIFEALSLSAVQSINSKIAQEDLPHYEFATAGARMKVSILVAIVCGILCSFILLGIHFPLVHFFAPNYSEREVLQHYYLFRIIGFPFTILFATGISILKHIKARKPVFAVSVSTSVIEVGAIGFGLYVPYNGPLSRAGLCGLLHSLANIFTAILSLGSLFISKSKRRAFDLNTWRLTNKDSDNMARKILTSTFSVESISVLLRSLFLQLMLISSLAAASHHQGHTIDPVISVAAFAFLIFVISISIACSTPLGAFGHAYGKKLIELATFRKFTLLFIALSMMACVFGFILALSFYLLSPLLIKTVYIDQQGKDVIDVLNTQGIRIVTAIYLILGTANSVFESALMVLRRHLALLTTTFFAVILGFVPLYIPSFFVDKNELYLLWGANAAMPLVLIILTVLAVAQGLRSVNADRVLQRVSLSRSQSGYFDFEAAMQPNPAEDDFEFDNSSEEAFAFLESQPRFMPGFFPYPERESTIQRGRSASMGQEMHPPIDDTL
eukprot:gb/GECH01002249.1/.p1 GENE.gb/GECH01002249.1/~~gb/GECH01002249.1/.p1  ORF type:complete len:567 (+),score=101.58 gb/GECH01002249.1/:1-1701(+)